jgi:hypothetical protein
MHYKQRYLVAYFTELSGSSVYIMQMVGRLLNKEMDSIREWLCSNGGTSLTLVWEAKEAKL